MTDQKKMKICSTIIVILFSVIGFFCVRLINGQEDLHNRLEALRVSNAAEIEALKGRNAIADTRQQDMEKRLDRIQAGIVIIQDDIKELLKRK